MFFAYNHILYYSIFISKSDKIKLYYMKIHLLSEQTINRIATGEIIDRPLSVVKELVENAIDAGASKCLINLERGGRTLISISDNGCGILKEDLKLAVTRYATSKLPDEDISNIQYMGFRGEALSSIATSARLRITSKTSQDSSAWMIDLSNGIDQYHIQPTSHKEGTTVDVENLFCFIPNRIRFIKPESTEIIACKNLIGALAICHQQIHFQLIHNQKEILNSRDNIMDEVLGENFLNNAIPFYQHYDDQEIKLHGYISIPTYNRTTRNKILTFVNKRLINDYTMNQWIKQGYFNTLPHNINPSVLLFIEIPSRNIDVNIHPNKSQVRFSDERLISNAIIQAIRNTIKNSRTSTINHIENKLLNNKNPIIHTNLELELRDRNYSIDNQDDIKYNNNGIKSLGQAIIQIAEKYIVAKKDNSIILIDQHAAHERIVLEKIKNMTFKVQNFITALEYDFGDAENRLIISMSYNLESIGIKISLVNNKILIHSIPAMPGNLDIITLLKDIIDNETIWEEIFNNHLDEVLKKLACYSSIRAGRKMTQSEMQQLLYLIETTHFSSQCIHGRPTYLELDLKLIDKFFERS